MQTIKPYEAMAKLALTETEREELQSRAHRLTESFAALENIDTAGVEPLVTVLDIQNVLREDVSARMMPREELLENAPEQYDGYFQVPRTLT